MPYIKHGDRERVAYGEPRAPLTIADTVGDLNFRITRLVDDYITVNGGPKYATFNAVLGVLTAVTQELYRRLIGPYEDLKRKEYGDVFWHGNIIDWEKLDV